jgi:hypothetical protein
MTHKNFNIQGRLLGMPYDWRKPTLNKALRRWWNPGGPMLSPKVIGWGWTLNLAHRGSWTMLAAVTVVLILLLAVA